MIVPELTLETGKDQRSRIRDLEELQAFALDWFIEGKRWGRDVFATETLWHLAPSDAAATGPLAACERGDIYTDIDGKSQECVEVVGGVVWKEVANLPDRREWKEPAGSTPLWPKLVWRRSAKWREMLDMFRYFVRECVKEKNGAHGEDWANWGAWYLEGKTGTELRHFFEFVVAAWDDWYEAEYPDASVHLAEKDQRDDPAIF